MDSQPKLGESMAVSWARGSERLTGQSSVAVSHTQSSELTFRFRILPQKDALILQRFSHGNGLWIVNRQHGDRYPSNLCSSLQLRPVPHEVLRPVVASGMEKAHNLSLIRVMPSHIRALEAIAMHTGKGEIFKVQSCHRVVLQ